jgi:hypothetical protein
MLVRPVTVLASAMVVLLLRSRVASSTLGSRSYAALALCPGRQPVHVLVECVSFFFSLSIAQPPSHHTSHHRYCFLLYIHHDETTKSAGYHRTSDTSLEGSIESKSRIARFHLPINSIIISIVIVVIGISALTTTRSIIRRRWCCIRILRLFCSVCIPISGSDR